MNTKAQFDIARKFIYWMIASVVISILIIFFAFFIIGYKEKLTFVPAELKAEIISLRFGSIEECFAYVQPETGRVLPGTIDLNKFTKENMEKCYTTEKDKGYRDINFQLELGDKKLPTNNYFNVPQIKPFERRVMVYNTNPENTEQNEPKEELLQIQVQLSLTGKP
ncbi:hypothetical protein J4437_03180 [Candidatus Woesearchaeota archaeon]|nr:hypothetical protein [Candidatus Woesearchaeota archaeon]